MSTRVNWKVDALTNCYIAPRRSPLSPRQLLGTVLLLCLQPKLEFLALACHGHAAAFGRFDAAILGGACAAAGWGLQASDA